MAIHNPPQYRYALFEQWDKEAFKFFRQIGKSGNYPKILGTSEDKNKYLITLIRTQKSLHDWRDLLKDTLSQVTQTGSLDLKLLLKKYPSESISKEIPSWVTYEEDRTVNNFIDQLETRRIDFIGTEKEMSEFVLRFILGQLGHDWEQTIMMIYEMLGNENSLYLIQLNKELKSFDYLRLFG